VKEEEASEIVTAKEVATDEAASETEKEENAEAATVTEKEATEEVAMEIEKEETVEAAMEKEEAAMVIEKAVEEAMAATEMAAMAAIEMVMKTSHV